MFHPSSRALSSFFYRLKDRLQKRKEYFLLLECGGGRLKNLDYGIHIHSKKKKIIVPGISVTNNCSATIIIWLFPPIFCLQNCLTNILPLIFCAQYFSCNIFLSFEKKKQKRIKMFYTVIWTGFLFFLCQIWLPPTFC